MLILNNVYLRPLFLVYVCAYGRGYRVISLMAYDVQHNRVIRPYFHIDRSSNKYSSRY